MPWVWFPFHTAFGQTPIYVRGGMGCEGRARRVAEILLLIHKAQSRQGGS